MVLRGELSSRTLSYIQLALDCMEKNTGSRAFAYDLQPVLDYPYRMIEKEYNKFLNRLHKIRIHYNLSEIDTFNEIMNLGDGWRDRDDDRRGSEPCLDRGVGWSVLAWTGSHS